MLFSRKSIFAGKRNLEPVPFCPYLSNESGYASIRRSSQASARRATKSGLFRGLSQR